MQARIDYTYVNAQTALQYEEYKLTESMRRLDESTAYVQPDYETMYKQLKKQHIKLLSKYDVLYDELCKSEHRTTEALLQSQRVPCYTDMAYENESLKKSVAELNIVVENQNIAKNERLLETTTFLLSEEGITQKGQTKVPVNYHQMLEQQPVEAKPEINVNVNLQQLRIPELGVLSDKFKQTSIKREIESEYEKLMKKSKEELVKMITDSKK
ncbi:Hypothetical_protein [Hexamita inflata]|uniref:Hypothetical_protein n=1 Tax=Hexamita inflata TaxID=28002 RepID=A0AA86QMW2_9EUKA|nr:Hypothetical protein HINF_LOCUS43599 [Hexamita inflata]